VTEAVAIAPAPLVLRRARGLAVAFLGPDGAGKSTIITALRAELRRRGIAHHYHHLRVRLRDGGSAEVVTDPHGRPRRGLFGSVAKLAHFWLSAWPAWLLRATPALRRGEWLILDRCFADLLCDPRRYRYGGPLWLARLVDRLMPRPDRLVVLHAPPEVIRARKTEVAAEELARQLDVYRALGERAGAVLVDTSASPERVLAQLLPHLDLGEPAP
jgi:thymidylate kinase